MKSKILVIGASSFVGKHFIGKFSGEEIIATYNNNKLKNAIRFNSLSDDLSRVIHNPEKIESAILFLGDTKPISCINNTELSHQLNVESIIRILVHLKEWKVKPIFISTEFVFDGKKGNYCEDNRTNPIVLYGKQKLLIEEYMQTNFNEYLIFRLAKVYGLNKKDKTIFTNWMEYLDQNETILCANDQRFSPIYAGDVVDVLYQFSKSNYSGVYHLGGLESYTRLELLELLIKERSKYLESSINIKTCKFNSFNLGEEWPVDVSMDVSKLMDSSNMVFMTPELACEKIVKTYFKERV
jgi:dTDP-4-dehydrorhamnose reductase